MIATSTRIPIRPAKARPGLAFALLTVLAVVTAVGALAAQGVYFRIALAFMVLLFVVTALLVRDFLGAARAGVIRVAAEGLLRCVPPRSVFIWPLVLAAVGTVPGVMFVLASVNSEEFGFSRRRSGALVFLTVMAIVWMAKQLWDLRTPVGLVIGPQGLRGVRGTKSFDADWALVAGAAAAENRGRAQLDLSFTHRGPVSVSSLHLGSDPNVVAAIIEYFRTHPEQRGALTESRTAILAVEDGIPRAQSSDASAW